MTDLSTPSYKAALTLAHAAAEAARIGGGRDRRSAEDNLAGHAVFAKLLMCVEPADGGLMDLDDDECAARAERYRIPPQALADAVWSAAVWPGTTERRE